MNINILPETSTCPQCNVIRRVTGTLGPRDGQNYLTLSTCGHVVLRNTEKE